MSKTNKVEVVSKIAFEYVEAIAAHNKEKHSKYDRKMEAYVFLPKYQKIFNDIYDVIFENLENDIR